MQDFDIICRVAIFPKFVSDGVFDDEQFLQFQALDQRKTVYAASVLSQFLMRVESAIHQYGNMIATIGNERLERTYDGNVPAEKICTYLGFYRLRSIDALSVPMTYYSVALNWRPENDCDAHFQIEMWQNAIVGNKRQRRNDRTAAVNQMVRALSGPATVDAKPGSDLSRLLSILPMKRPEASQSA